MVVVRPAVASKERPDEAVRAWVQATRIGLDAFADGETLLAWANDLASGRPAGGVELSLGPVHGRTRDDGLARLALGDAPAPLLVARRGADVAILPQADLVVERGSRLAPHGARRDAALLRLRRPQALSSRRGSCAPRAGSAASARDLGGDVEPLPASVRGVAWKLVDSQGNESAKGRADLGATGAFDVALTLPKTFNLGSASLQLEAEGTDLPGRGHVHGFLVQEFRRPEFEVKASPSAGPYVTGGSATVAVSAAYYAGGALPGAEVTWRVAAQPAFYRPPNRDDYVFGTFVPWWRPVPVGPGPERSETFTARTDGTGVHRLRVDFEKQEPPRPRLVTPEATVMDVNRQAWTAAAPLLVHPSLRYVGLRPERAFVQKDEDIALDVIATDLDGALVAGSPVSLRLERLEWEQVEGEWKEVPQDVEHAHARTPGPSPFAHASGRSRAAAGACSRASPTRRGARTRPSCASGSRAAACRRGATSSRRASTLVPDRKEYRAGDVARLLVVSPFAPAEGVLTLRRSGLVREERFTITSGSHTLEIPIEEAFTPNVHVQVDLVGQAPRDDASRAVRSRHARPSPAGRSISRSRRLPARSRSRSRHARRRSSRAARPCSTCRCGTPRARRSRTARRRSWSWTRRCSRSRAIGCPTRSTSSTRAARPTSRTTVSARTCSSRRLRTSRRRPTRCRSAQSRAAPSPCSPRCRLRPPLPRCARRWPTRRRPRRRFAPAPTSRRSRCSPRACRSTRTAARASR